MNAIIMLSFFTILGIICFYGLIEIKPKKYEWKKYWPKDISEPWEKSDK